MKKCKWMIALIAAMMTVFTAVPAFAAVPAAAAKAGMQTIEGKSYYYGKDLKLVKSKKAYKIGKKYYDIDKTGAATQWKGVQANAAKKLIKIKAVPKNTKAKTLKKSLKKAFQWSAKLTFKTISKKVKSDTKALTYFGNYGFKNDRGDCVTQAATFCAMAQVLGYDAKLVRGYVPQVNGTFGDHAWVEVTIKGKVYVCDPNLNSTYKNAGYLVEYGTKGKTYKYHDAKKKEIQNPNK